MIIVVHVVIIKNPRVNRKRTMAQLSTPKQFNFSNSDDWPRWKNDSNSFVTHLVESEQRQVSTLLYCLGEDADDVLVSTNITEDERKRYKGVILNLAN